MGQTSCMLLNVNVWHMRNEINVMLYDITHVANITKICLVGRQREALRVAPNATSKCKKTTKVNHKQLPTKAPSQLSHWSKPFQNNKHVSVTTTTTANEIEVEKATRNPKMSVTNIILKGNKNSLYGRNSNKNNYPSAFFICISFTIGIFVISFSGFWIICLVIFVTSAILMHSTSILLLCRYPFPFLNIFVYTSIFVC